MELNLPISVAFIHHSSHSSLRSRRSSSITLLPSYLTAIMRQTLARSTSCMRQNDVQVQRATCITHVLEGTLTAQSPISDIYPSLRSCRLLVSVACTNWWSHTVVSSCVSLFLQDMSVFSNDRPSLDPLADCIKMVVMGAPSRSLSARCLCHCYSTYPIFPVCSMTYYEKLCGVDDI